jgi:hypothetical protein
MRGNRRRAASRAAGCCPGRSRPASDCRDLRARPVADLPPPRRPRPGHRRLRRCRRNRQGCSRSRSPVPRLKRLPRSVAAAGVTGVRGAATSFLTPRPSTAATYQTTAEPLHFCRASPEELSISAEPRHAVARIRRGRFRWGISIACGGSPSLARRRLCSRVRPSTPRRRGVERLRLPPDSSRGGGLPGHRSHGVPYRGVPYRQDPAPFPGCPQVRVRTEQSADVLAALGRPGARLPDV